MKTFAQSLRSIATLVIVVASSGFGSVARADDYIEPEAAPGTTTVVLTITINHADHEVSDVKLRVRGQNHNDQTCNPNSNNCDGLKDVIGGSVRVLPVVFTAKNPRCVTVTYGGTTKSYCN